MGCVCFCEIMSGIFKSRLGSHGYTWCLACERRRISSRRVTFRAEGSNNRKSSAFAGLSNWDGILSKNPTGNFKFIKKGKASGHLFLPIWFHQKIFCGQSEDWRSLGLGPLGWVVRRMEGLVTRMFYFWIFEKILLLSKRIVNFFLSTHASRTGVKILWEKSFSDWIEHLFL